MAANTGKRNREQPALSRGYSIWMAAGVFLLYFSFGIGAIVLAALAAHLLYRYRGGQKKSEQYGKTVVRPVVAELFEQALYEPNGGFSRETIAGLGILHRTRRYQSRHRIAGRYRGVAFEAAAVLLAHQKHFFSSKPYAPVFDGLFLAVSWPREDRGTVRVIPASYQTALPQCPGPAVTGKAAHKEAGRVYPVAVSHAGFAERFFVFAQHPDAAAALLQDPFCDRFLSFADAAGAPVLLCFSGDRLYIGLDRKRPMPFDAPAPAGQPEVQKQAVRDSLRPVTDCIDLFLAPELRPE